MDSFDHEKVLKILQSMRSEKPIISICTDLHRSFSLEQAVKAIGFRTIFSSFKNDNNFTLPPNMTSLLDFSFLIDKTPEQARTILRSYKKQAFKILSIGEEIHFVSQNALKILKGCLRTKPDVIICDHNIAEEDLKKAVTEAGSRLFMKSDYKPIILRISPEGDILSDGDTSLIDSAAIFLTIDAKSCFLVPISAVSFKEKPLLKSIPAAFSFNAEPVCVLLCGLIP